MRPSGTTKRSRPALARPEPINLFLSAAVFPRARGWLGRLLMEMRRLPDAGAISPTLLYEDDSVRFAGNTDMPDFKAGVLIERFRGYGRHWLEGEHAAPVWSGTAECCVSGKSCSSRSAASRNNSWTQI